MDVIPHLWQKLRQIWKDLRKEWKKAKAKNTLLGHHEDFYKYCDGNVDVLYLQKKLELKPNLTSFVAGDLPEACALSSEDNAIIKKSKKKGRAGIVELADAIRSSLGDQNNEIEQVLMQRKIDYMLSEEKRLEFEEARKQKEDTRRKKDDDWKENKEICHTKEETRREAEHRMRKADHQMNLAIHEMKQRQSKVDKWERLKDRVRQINVDLRDPDIDDDEKKDLKQDREDLKTAIHNLAVLLGFAPGHTNQRSSLRQALSRTLSHTIL